MQEKLELELTLLYSSPQSELAPRALKLYSKAFDGKLLEETDKFSLKNLSSPISFLSCSLADSRKCSLKLEETYEKK